MNIGFCTTDLDTMPVDTLFGKLSDFGFEVTQFAFASAAECEYTPDDHIEVFDRIPFGVCEKIARASNVHNVPITAVNGTFNMAHISPEVRLEGVRRFEEFAKAAISLGASVITLCSGTRSDKTLWSYHPDNNGEAAWNDMTDSMKRVVDIAERYGVTLAIEPEASNVINTPEKARTLIDGLGSDKLGMIMDAANLFHVGKAHRENAAEVMNHAFDVLGSDIVLAHGKDIKDTDGIEFCATGEGIVDFELFGEGLGRIGFEGDFMIHGVYDEKKIPSAVEIARKTAEVKLRSQKV